MLRVRSARAPDHFRWGRAQQNAVILSEAKDVIAAGAT